MPDEEILDPTLAWKNKKGEVVFAIKRKDQWGPIYYIFEKHEDRIEPGNRAKFDDAWQVIKIAAGTLRIPLYDASELRLMYMRAIEEYTKKTGKDLPDNKTIDLEIPVFDHATGEISNLVIGVTKTKAKWR